MYQALDTRYVLQRVAAAEKRAAREAQHREAAAAACERRGLLHLCSPTRKAS